MDTFNIDPSGFSLSGGDTGGFDAGSGGFGIDPSGFSLSGGGGSLSPFDPSLFNLGVDLGFGGALPNLPFNQQPLNLPPEQGYIQRLQSLLTPSQGAGGLLEKSALALPVIGALGGLAGIFQQMSQGRPVTKTSSQRGPATPQEQAILAQTLSQLSRMQGLAQNAEIQQAISRLASGQLPISSDLVDQVTKAFSAVAANTAEQSIEGARERGFSGGTELIGGAGSPQYSRQMAQVQSDVSQALVNLALGLPQAASNINAQQMNTAAIPVQQNIGLLGQLGAQAPITQTQTGPQPSLLQSLAPLGQLMGGLGGALGGYSMATRPQQQPIYLSGYGSNLSGTANG